MPSRWRWLRRICPRVISIDPSRSTTPLVGGGLVGDADAAVSWLQVAWDEGIESLMISFAACDPSFDGMNTLPAFEEVMGLAREMELGVERLGGSVYRLSGAGSNVVAQVGDDGVFLIDTGYFPVFASLQRAVSSLESGEVSRLLITHPHDDPVGVAAELGTVATVWAHPGTTAAMDEP